MTTTTTDRAGKFFIAPATAPTDAYAAGYDANVFDTEEEAEAFIPALRTCGEDFAATEWTVSRYPAPECCYADCAAPVAGQDYEGDAVCRAHLDAEAVVRDLARQDRASEESTAHRSAEECIAGWRRAAGEAGDLACIAALDLIGDEQAAEVYDAERKALQACDAEA